MRTEKIEIRLFIEGIRVAHIGSVTVQTYAGEQAQASFTLPPIPGFETEELKRARVHIFWSDIEIRSSRADDDWPILFEGEITADSYSKSPTSRSQVYHCSGYSTYWEQIMLYYFDQSHPTPSMAPWAQQMAVSLGNKSFGFDGQVAGANLRQRLVTEIEENADLNYHSIVKKIFGEALDVNHFFRTQNEALKLDQRFATPADPNIGVLLGRNRLREGLELDIMSVGGQKPMMEVLKATLELFRYQIVHNAQPVLMDQKVVHRRTQAQVDTDVATQKKRLNDYLTTVTGVDGQKLTDTVIDQVEEAIDGNADEDIIVNQADVIVKALGFSTAPEDLVATNSFRNLVELALRTTNNVLFDASNTTLNGDDQFERSSNFDDLLSQFLIIPDTRFAHPPTCNVIFPQDQTGFSLDRQLMQEPTRGISTPFTDVLPFALMLAPPELNKAVIPTRVIAPSTTSGFHPPVIAPHRISSGYGFRQIRQKVDTGLTDSKGAKIFKVKHPDGRKFHHGLDIARPRGTKASDFEGKADVHAFDEGTIVRAGFQDSNPKKGYGLRVYINHSNGMQTRYCHLASIYDNIKKGARVARGQVIGKVGNTGSSTGAHLHFEVRVGGSPEDPAPLIALAEESNAQGESTSGTDEAATGATEEKPITDAGNNEERNFKDFEYLSPEEQITGIVPFFDLETARAHSFMAFGGGAESPEDKKKQKLEAESYMLQMLNAEFLWRRYQTRSLSALSGPFNPNPVAGFPGLVVDRNRSLIGMIQSVSHTISVGGGNGNASTTVQMHSPRYWDEGDPYYWDGGEAETSSQDGFDLPDPNKGVFPSYYLQSLVGTNSAKNGDTWWDEQLKPPKIKDTPSDKLYQQLFGGNVRGIPYQFATRATNRDVTVSYNKAIDSRGARSLPNTIVGRYYYLADKSKDATAAEDYVRNFTRRRGVSEKELMGLVLGATSDNGGFSYAAPAFRAGYQATVRRLNEILGADQAFRG
jgi:murein DD-endopeptidase MepM/ murein hydrolase activator NlpD